MFYFIIIIIISFREINKIYHISNKTIPNEKERKLPWILKKKLIWRGKGRVLKWLSWGLRKNDLKIKRRKRI